jgi:hypothetical protein
MTEDELVKEIERRTQKANSYVWKLRPFVSQMFTDQAELFDKALPRPDSLKSTKTDGCIRFVCSAYEYSLASTYDLRIARRDLQNERWEVLLHSENNSIKAFVDGDWSHDIITFAAVLHEALEPERIRQKQAVELERQKKLHAKAKALGIPSPFNFPEPHPAPPTPIPPPQPYVKPITPKQIHNIILALVVIALVIYFIARMY